MREAVKKNGVVIYKWLRRFFGKIFLIYTEDIAM